MGYLSAQERSGLTEKQVRKIVREEIQKAAKSRKSKIELIQPVVAMKDIVNMEFEMGGGAMWGFTLVADYSDNRVVEFDDQGREVFQTPEAITFSSLGSSAASRAIAAAAKAVETDQSLSKKQRVAALKALDAARRAIEGGQKTRKGRAGARKKARADRKKAAKKRGEAPTKVRYRLAPATKSKAKLKPAKTYQWVIPKNGAKTWILPSFGGSRSDLYFDGDASKTMRWEFAPAKKDGKRRILLLDPKSGEATPLPKKHNLLLRTGNKGLHYFLSTPKTDSKKKAAPEKAKRPAKIHF